MTAYRYTFIGPYTDDEIVVTAGSLMTRAEEGAHAAGASATETSTAFIEVSFNTKVSFYRFPLSQVQRVVPAPLDLQPGADVDAAGAVEARRFELRIGDSTFTESGLTLSIMPAGVTARDIEEAGGNTIMGDVQFEDVVPSASASTLEWLLAPFLRRSHSTLSLHHKLHGYLSVGDVLTDLEMGTGHLAHQRMAASSAHQLALTQLQGEEAHAPSDEAEELPADAYASLHVQSNHFTTIKSASSAST
jgi:hypothetical protein